MRRSGNLLVEVVLNPLQRNYVETVYRLPNQSAELGHDIADIGKVDMFKVATLCSMETEDLPFPARNLRKMAKGDRRSTNTSADGKFDEPIGETTFEITHQELRNTFEYQFQRLQEIDGKAIEILKANLLLIGIVVTGASILIQTDLELGPFLNIFTATGGALLLVSTGVAAVTYTASNLRGGLEADAVEAAITASRAGNTQDEGLVCSRSVCSGAVPSGLTTTHG